jgi:hypothetical protein
MWVDKALKWSGLSLMDRIGKTTTMNSAFNKASKMKKEEFDKEYGILLGEAAEETYNDLKARKNTKATRFFVFNELSDWQPISMSEMPLKYLELRNGRIFYTLKSFNIKALNSIYRELVHGYRSAENVKEKALALRNTGKLIFLIALAGASADELKDLLLGRGAKSFSDHFHENILKMGMLSRYTLDRGMSQGIIKTFLADTLVPPTNWLNDPFKDVYNTFIKEEPDFRTITNLPWGKLPYAWYSDKAEESDFNGMKKRIVESVVGGDSVSKVRKDMYKYNKWAKANDKTPITYKSLMKAKREAMKK